MYAYNVETLSLLDKRFCFPKAQMLHNVERDLKTLNTTHFTSATRKAHRLCKRVHEGTDVDVLWPYVVEETGIPG